MEKITVATHYWIFKKYDAESSIGTQYYCVRIENEAYPENYIWMMGFKNKKGFVETRGVPFDDEKSLKLEFEFRRYMKNRQLEEIIS